MKSLSLAVIDRFIIRIGEDGFKEILARLVTECVKRGILAGKHITIDGFPIHSFLNTTKCLKLPEWKDHQFVNLFSQLAVEETVELLPAQHGRNHPALDKVKTTIIALLWTFPSDTIVHKFLFGKRNLVQVIGYIKPIKSVQTWKKFTDVFFLQPEYESARQQLLSQLLLLPEIRVVLPTNWTPTSILDLKGIFCNTHAAKDPGSRSNYCASKNETFWEREGVIITDQPTGLTLMLRIQVCSKITGKDAVKMLDEFITTHKDKIAVESATMDREFDIEEVHTCLATELRITDHGLRKNASDQQRRIQKPWQRLRLSVERCIAFLTLHFDIEYPRCRGDQRIRCWTQLCGICQLLVALMLFERGIRTRYNRIRLIRG